MTHLIAGPDCKLNLEKVAVLLVQHNKAELDILSQTMAGLGIWSTRKCMTAADAMAASSQQDIDLMVIEADLPQMSGYDLVRELRQSPTSGSRTAATIILKGYVSKENVLRGRDCGANFVLAKPITPGILFDRILWLARERRAFVDSSTYSGPDRRFRKLGPPTGTAGRRRDDLSADVGVAKEPNLSQDDINAMFKPQKVSL